MIRAVSPKYNARLDGCHDPRSGPFLREATGILFGRRMSFSTASRTEYFESSTAESRADRSSPPGRCPTSSRGGCPLPDRKDRGDWSAGAGADRGPADPVPGSRGQVTRAGHGSRGGRVTGTGHAEVNRRWTRGLSIKSRPKRRKRAEPFPIRRPRSAHVCRLTIRA
jgi:hypothetical protein